MIGFGKTRLKAVLAREAGPHDSSKLLAIPYISYHDIYIEARFRRKLVPM
jgi:hypothetical protein